MDMITHVGDFPSPGQTVQGLSFAVTPGGKGANQAVALARLGACVSLVGAVGDDALGRNYLAVLDSEGVDRSMVKTWADETTGTATILVARGGENQIVIVPGANGRVSPAALPPWGQVFQNTTTLLLQLEVPLDTVEAAARAARNRGVRVILDPAPARPLPPELLKSVDILTPNQTEATLLSGYDASTEAGVQRAAEALLSTGVGLIIVKAGPRGAYVASPSGLVHVPGFRVDTVDTVAAGDSFNAGLAFALGQGDAPETAMRFANAVAALSTTKPGAQAAMPRLSEVRALLG